MAFQAALIPIMKAMAAGAATGAASAGVAKAGSKKHLPPVTGGAPMMAPPAGSQQSDIVKSVLLQHLKEEYADSDDKEEAADAQAKAVAKAVAEAAKR